MLYSYTERIKTANEIIQNAEYVIIGAGAGLSAAAGLEYSGKRFTDNFQSFIRKYDMEDLYTSSFYPFKTEEEKWAYWAKHISLNRYEIPATELYIELLQFLQEKEYFVITTNVDGQFKKAGFDSNRLFEVQGDYAYLQCIYGCHDTLYNNEDIVKKMIVETVDYRVPSYLVPKCPKCGCEMDVNLRKDQYFVQDKTWHESSTRYSRFLAETKNKPTAYIEIGVGFNTPVIIKYPFEEMVYKNPKATLIRINRDYPASIKENKESTISFDENVIDIIDDMRNNDKVRKR